MYHVVICPKCTECVWIVEGMPDTTECRSCGHTRKLQRLQHIHKTDNKAEAEFARAKSLAIRGGNLDQFERAVEAGAITGEPDTNLGISVEDLATGVTDAELKEVDDRSTSGAGGASVSRGDAILNTISKSSDDATRGEVLDSVENSYDFDSEKIERTLEKLIRNGDVRESSNGGLVAVDP